MQVLLHPIPKKYLERLNEPDKGNIKAALQGLEHEPPIGKITPLQGQPGQFKLTIRGFRALFRYKDDYIYVTHIDPRGQVYNKKNMGGKR